MEAVGAEDWGTVALTTFVTVLKGVFLAGIGFKKKPSGANTDEAIVHALNHFPQHNQSYLVDSGGAASTILESGYEFGARVPSNFVIILQATTTIVATTDLGSAAAFNPIISFV